MTQKRSSAPSPPDARLSRIALVLDHPKDVVNIGGVMRVMKNFGLTDLRLVNPDAFDAYRLEGIAHRSLDLIESCSIHDDLDVAISDATFVVGTSARARTAGVTYVKPAEVAARVAERTREGVTAILFGREDRGLTNEALDRCHAVTVIPTSPDYSSLNLAQAALVMAYEAFLAIDGGMEEMPRGRRATRPPTHEEYEQAYTAIDTGLRRLDFYKARKPESVMRTIRAVLSRATPDLRELRLFAAIGYEIGNVLDRPTAFADRERPDASR